MDSQHSKKNIILSLFLTFLKIGAFTFGGGYAMIPMIQREVVDKKKWLSGDDILDIIAIAETTPGPIAINAATFIGQKTSGFWGAFCATLGVVIPSFIIITLIAIVYKSFKGNPIVENAFWGIRIGVLALIVKALINMIKHCPKNVFSYFIAIAAFGGVAFFNINVIFVIAVAAVVGLIYQSLSRRHSK